MCYISNHRPIKRPLPNWGFNSFLRLIFLLCQYKHLIWSSHFKQKRKSANSRLHLLRPLLKSKLCLTNKLTSYKSIIFLVWLNSIQHWWSTKPSHTLLGLQFICLHLITSAPWYVSKKNLHKYLNLPTLNA